MRTARWLCLAVGCGVCLAGCRSIPSTKALFKPVVQFGAVDDPLEMAKGKYLPFREALAKELDRPVGVDVLLLPQDIPIRFLFGSMDFAFIKPGHFEYASENDIARPFIVLTDTQGRRYTDGWFLVRKDSPIKSLQDLRGKSLVLGPRDDVVTHLAALHALRKVGIQANQLGKVDHEGLFAQPLALLMQGKVDAIVLRSDAYDALDPTSAERQKTRTIGRTTPVPHRLILARKDADPKLVNAVHQWLLQNASKSLEIITPLKTRGFADVSPAEIATLREVFRLRHHPATSPASRPTDTPGPGPSP